MRIKKIIYVGYKYELSSKGKKLYAHNYNAWYKTFIELGYETESVFYDDFNEKTLILELSKRVKEFSPDLLFFVLSKDQFSIEDLEFIKKLNVTTLNFFGDDNFRYDNYSKYRSKYFDWCVTTDKFSYLKYKAANDTKVILSQWASFFFQELNTDIKYRYAVSFVGGYSPYRKWFIDQLKQKFQIDVSCYGNGWPNGPVGYEDIQKIISLSKINLNIPNSYSYDYRYNLNSIKNFIKIFLPKHKNASQIKARNFEIPSSNGFQLTNYVPFLEDYFELGKEVVCYSNLEEAALLINYYLNNEKIRKNILKNSYNNVILNHTFKNRIKDIITEVEKFYVK